MSVALALVVGGVVGTLTGALFIWVPEEEHTIGVLLGSALRNALVGLMTVLSLTGGDPWYAAAGFGAIYGLASGLTVVLPEGGIRNPDARYVLPFSLGEGAVIGAFIGVFA